MSYFDQKPTEDNLAKALENDCLNRNEELINLIKLLDFPDSCFTIAVDGGWGSGKTFLVKQAVSILNYSNDVLDLKLSETAEGIMKTWRDITRNEKEEQPRKLHFAAYYDAWEHDDAEDPILSVLFQLTKATGVKMVDIPRLREIGDRIIGALAKDNESEFITFIKGDGALRGEEKADELRALIKEYLRELSQERAQRFDLFIDELDRCNPCFAIKLLERIKHYFDCENITFIFSVNIKELKKTISRYYGDEFDGVSYLDKFFDIRVSLNTPRDLESFFGMYGLHPRSMKAPVYSGVCYHTARHFGMNLREIIHYIRLVELASAKHISAIGDYDCEKMLHTLFAPILIAMKMKNPEKYEKCIKGESGEDIVNVLSGWNGVRHYMNQMKDSTEAFDWDDDKTGKTIIDEATKVEQIYNALFPPDRIKMCTNFGEILVYGEAVEKLIETCSLLSGDLSFEKLEM